MTDVNHNRLRDFLYVLVRDHVPMGDIDGILWDQVDTDPSSYCNSFLEGYVNDLIERLTNPEKPITSWKHMYRSADGKERYYIDSDGNRVEAPREFVTVSNTAKAGARYHRG